MKLSENRLSPSDLTPDELDALERFSELSYSTERPALVGRKGLHLELPDAVFHHLVRVVRAMKNGEAVVLVPEKECFTTQAAAQMLGVSRPFFVKLIEKGQIPYHKVGSHRRVYFKDLLEYIQTRDQKRRATLDSLSKDIIEAGIYDSIDPEHAG